MNFKKILLCCTAVPVLLSASAEPKLTLNLIISGMPQRVLHRYDSNLNENGLKHICSQGREFTECYVDFGPTLTFSTLATLATGTLPGVSGISSTAWIDRASMKREELFRMGEDEHIEFIYRGVKAGHYFAPTLSETFRDYSEGHHAIVIASDQLSAMALAGKDGECYWLDAKGNWCSGDEYMEKIPSWVSEYNFSGVSKVFSIDTWYAKYPKAKYINTKYDAISIYDGEQSMRNTSSRKEHNTQNTIHYTPAGNLATLSFVQKAIENSLSNKKDKALMVTVCLEAPRYIAQKYGLYSIEYEDMFYNLDERIADLMEFIRKSYPNRSDVLITLSSDHGMCDDREAKEDVKIVDMRQNEVILNAFLSSRYGPAKWLLGIWDNCVYLNHDVIYAKGFSVEKIQNEIASFMLQLRGIAVAVTATSLHGSQCPGLAAYLQHGYNPRRSGDVIYSLLPGCIEAENYISDSGTVYTYDRHVPLIIYGTGADTGKYHRKVSTESIAPTIAKMAGISRPALSDSELLQIY